MNRNEVSGTVAGPSIQAKDIRGGVHFHGALPPEPVVPRQVPPPSPHFTGRREQLEMLRRAAAQPGFKVIVLSGAGGTGKTAVACQWAHEAAGLFAGGQLFLGLDAFGPGPPRHPAEALRSSLRSLGVPADGLPSDLADLTALYRSRTAGRSLLVIADDAFSAAQVRVLLPASPTSMTVVTSRSRLSGLVAEGATIIDLAPLTTDDSVTLLTSALGRTRVESERRQAARLADLCAGLPLALCLAAARLSTRPRSTIAGVVAALADETARLARFETPGEEVSVRGSFELSYRALDEPAASLYRRLALHPGPEFGLGPVKALMTDTARLDLLLEVNLLQEVTEERFRFHDLVRLHALQKAAEDDTDAVRDRALLAIVEWYLAAASVADGVATPYRRRLGYRYRTAPAGLPTFGDREQALAWLDRERTNLGAAGQAALDHRWADLAWQLSDVLWPLQLYRKSVDHKEIDARGLAAGRMWGDPRAEGRMLKRLGRTMSTLGDYEQAEELLASSVARFAEAGDVEGIEAEEMLALSYRDAGLPDAAADLLQQVLETRRHLRDHRGLGLTLINLGELSSRQGRAAEAIGYLREAGELLDASSATDPYNPVRVMTGLARAYLAADDLPSADRAAAEAIDGMRRLGVAVGEAEALELAGVIAVRCGDVTRGRVLLRRALEIFEAHGSPRAAALRGQLPEDDSDQAGDTDDDN